MRRPDVGGHGIATVWVALFAGLSTAPVLKIADVQAVEWAQLLWLAQALPVFIYGGMRIHRSGNSRYSVGYAVFLAACVALAAVSFRLEFYTPPDISVLKQPFILSLSRVFEYFMASFFMVKLAGEMRRNRSALRLALNIYIGAGVLSAILSIAGWIVVNISGVNVFTVYGYDERVRGFFNEGGPYGVFLVSVAVALVVRALAFRNGFGLAGQIAFGLLLVALLLSGSKAGLLVAAGLLGLGVAFAGNRWQRAATVGGGALIVCVLLTLFQGKLLGYAYAYMDLDEALAYRPGDPSLIMGRIAAAAILPRMISEHPVLGIGPGNYSLMRNDPNYLQGLPPVDDWDLPGMGLFGAAAELGIPTTVFFLFLLMWPLKDAVRQRAGAGLAVCAGFQPLAFLVGVNLNFFYPWLVAGFVISLLRPPSEGKS
jgi:hypothetical protein